jgi:hypothetical protein
MRQVDDATAKALLGSRAGDKLVVYVWYDGNLVYDDPLQVANWKFSWDAGRQVQSLNLTVVDSEGKLAPWLFEDPLGVGGSRLQVRYDIGSSGSINMGWYRIKTSTPKERWHSYVINERGRVNRDLPVPVGKKSVMLSGGATISITAYDLAYQAKLSRLIAPESPKTQNVVDEIKRLMADIAPVVTMSGVVDQPISPRVVYERDRLDAIQDLCKRISCDYRMNGDGQLEVYPLAAQDPLVTLTGGEEGLLIDVDRSQDCDGLYNRFVVDGIRRVTQSDGSILDVPVRGIASITVGPLRVDGPHGSVPEFYSSSMITTQEQADAYALEMMNTQLRGLTVDLAVTAAPLPYLQQGDWVKVGNPVVNGQSIDLVGRVKAMELGSNGTTTDKMTVVVQCLYVDVQRVLGGVDRG